MPTHRISEYNANRLLDEEFADGVYMAPYDGDPGEDGLSNLIADVPRVLVPEFSPAVDKSVSNVDAFSFDDLPECSIAYWGAWDSLTGGNFLRSTPRMAGSPPELSPLDVSAGDSVTIAASSCVFRISNVEI